MGQLYKQTSTQKPSINSSQIEHHRTLKPLTDPRANKNPKRQTKFTKTSARLESTKHTSNPSKNQAAANPKHEAPNPRHHLSPQHLSRSLSPSLQSRTQTRTGCHENRI